MPFLPYYPTFTLLATAERMSTGANAMITADAWPAAIDNDYVQIGILRYLGDACRVEYGAEGEADAWNAIKHALEHFEFTTIADAHSAKGRYHTCVCGS